MTLILSRQKLTVIGILLSLWVGCRQNSKPVDSTGANVESLTRMTPLVGRIDDDAGFFVDVLSASSLGEPKYSIHKGVDTFDEPCEAEVGQVVDCILDAEESTLLMQTFSLHYHVPSSMCAYFSIEPFYFVNRRTKLTDRLIRHIDAFGDVGIDSDNDGKIDSDDFGCYLDRGEAACCVGNYNETTFVWDAASGRYGSPSTISVRRKIDKCLGGPATLSQPRTELGIPLKTFKYVEGVGISATYEFQSLLDHGVGPSWIANYFDPSQHNNAPPRAFADDIDPSSGELNVGHPYYTFSCLDAAFELTASIRVKIREWNTSADFLARRSSPSGHDENGAESDPWNSENKNDYPDWLDFQTAGIVHPGLEYQP